MNSDEKLLSEAVKNMLQQDAKLGLSYHKPPHEKRESSHFFQYQWESVDDMYQLAISESKFSDSLSAAFYKVHSYKYVDDPSFKIALDAELRSMGIPKEDRELALKSLDKVLKEVKGERDAGWNPRLEELVDVTTNADKHKMSQEPPWTGGGPAPQPVTRGSEPFAKIEESTIRERDVDVVSEDIPLPELGEMEPSRPEKLVPGKKTSISGTETSGLSVIKLTDVDDVVKHSKGTKWDLQDPKYAKLYLEYGPLYLFLDGDKKIAMSNPKVGKIYDPDDKEFDLTSKPYGEIIKDFMGQHPYIPGHEPVPGAEKWNVSGHIAREPGEIAAEMGPEA